MPSVPRYQRQVEPAALPQVKVPTSAPVADPGPSFAAARGMIADSQKQAAAAEASANKAWKDDKDAILKNAKNDFVYGQNGFTLLQGQKAIGAVEEYRGRFKKLAEELQGTASNDSQRADLEALIRDEGAEYDGALMRHASRETNSIIDQTHGSKVAALVDDAVLNYGAAGKVEKNTAKLREEIGLYAEQRGMGPEWAEAEVTRKLSNLHRGVIDRLIAGGDARAARAWGEKYGASITSKADRTAVDRGLNIVTKQARIEEQSARILTEKTDEAAAIQEANDSIKDEDELKAVKKSIRDTFTERARIDWKDRSVILDGAYTLVDQTGAMPDALTLTKMTDQEARSLQRYLSLKKTGKPIPTDEAAYYELLDMAISPESQAAFMKTHLQGYKSKLSDEKYTELVNIQQGLLGGDKKTAAKVWGLSSTKEMVTRMTQELKLSKGQERVFRANIDKQIEVQEAQLERKLTKDEVRGVFDWFAIEPSRAFRVDVPLGTYTIEDVPDDVRDEMVDLYRAKTGRMPDSPPSDDEVLQYYRDKVRATGGK